MFFLGYIVIYYGLVRFTAGSFYCEFFIGFIYILNIIERK